MTRLLIPLVLVVLLTLLQSCGNNPVLQPRAEPGREPETEKRAADAVAQVTSEFLHNDPDDPEAETAAQPAVAAVVLPESVLGLPETDAASRATLYDTALSVRTFDAPLGSSWEYRKNRQDKIVGFEFSNRGGNAILPHRYNIDKSLFFTRDFQFRFDDRARQDIHLFVSDWTPSRDRQFRLSELMNSVIHFFPRNYVPAIVNSGGRTLVKLPTGEEVEFDADTYEVLGGVFAEAPVDLNPDRAARKFAGIQYTGRGVVVRADARGADPRLGTTATISTASPECAGADCNHQCRVPSKELWEQGGAVRFRFSTDEEFDRYLLARCGFGLPQNDPRFIIAATLS